MAQFDAHRNLDPRTRNEIPFLIDVQSGLLAEIKTRVVVPLVRANAVSRPFSRLNPKFRVNGLAVVLDTAQIAGIPKNALGPVVANLARSRDTIVAAIDVLITGV